MSGIRCDPTDPAEVTSARVEDSDEPVSFDAFCSRELDWARRLAFVLTGSRDAADDIAQEGFARICRHSDRLDNPRAYLRVVIALGAAVFVGRRRGASAVP